MSQSPSSFPFSISKLLIILSETFFCQTRGCFKKSFAIHGDEASFLLNLTSLLSIHTGYFGARKENKEQIKRDRFIVGWNFVSSQTTYFIINLEMTSIRLICKSTFKDAARMVYDDEDERSWKHSPYRWTSGVWWIFRRLCRPGNEGDRFDRTDLQSLIATNSPFLDKESTKSLFSYAARPKGETMRKPKCMNY